MINKSKTVQMVDTLLTIMKNDLQCYFDEIIVLFYALRRDYIGVKISGREMVHIVSVNLKKNNLTTVNLSLPANFYFALINFKGTEIFDATTRDDINIAANSLIEEQAYDDAFSFACAIIRNVNYDHNLSFDEYNIKYISESRDVINALISRLFVSWEDSYKPNNKQLH